MIKGIVEVQGLTDIQERVTRLGLNAKDLRRPNVFIAQELPLRNRKRLDQGVDVNGLPLKSKLAGRLGLVPLGGAHGLFGKSVHGAVDGQDVDLFSDFIGAAVAYYGKRIVPKTKQYLTIPARARGGEFARADRALEVLGNRTGRRALHYSRKTTFFLRRNGKLMLMQKTGKGSLRVLFFLVKSVRWPRNEWLGASPADLDMIADRYGQHLDTFDDSKGGR